MVGDTIKVNGVDLLILDELPEGPFVWAYNLDIETKFGENSNSYKESILKVKTENWFAETELVASPRILNLLSVNGDSEDSMAVIAAPLTFDEYRKYQAIIAPHIKKNFWTSTPWNSVSAVCSINYHGSAHGSVYWNTDVGMAPAFILDKSRISNPLEYFSTHELLTELNRRFAK